MVSYQCLVHLSDLHLSASGQDEDGVDAVRSLLLVLESLRFVDNVSAVVVSGDLADDGSVAGCHLALDLVGSWARERGAACVFTVGNHDSRAAFTEVLGSGHRDEHGADVGERGPAGTCAAVSEVNGLRIVSLDSLVPGKTHGEIGENQLAWLNDVLKQPTIAGTVLAFHHPPLWPPGYPVSDVVLRDPGPLGEVIAGSDVRAVLTGHLHHQLSGLLAGIPVWVTPGVVTRIDTSAPPALVRGVLGGGSTVFELGTDTGPVFRLVHARDPRAGQQVYLYDLATGADVSTENSPL